MTEAQIQRYSRHILLPDVGGVGQQRLLGAAVSVEVGADRASELVAIAYLAAAGVGRIELTGDLNGAVGEPEVRAGLLLGAQDLGAPRQAAIARRVAALNPDVALVGRAEGRAIAVHTEPATTLVDALIAGAGAAARTIAGIARSRRS